MDWVKVETTFHDHRKTSLLDAFAVGIWTLCLSWCGRQETDGFVPALVVRRLGGEQGLEAAARLVRAGLWELEGDDWRFHDWASHQETHEDIERRREEMLCLQEAAREYGRTGGRRSAQVRRERYGTAQPKGSRTPPSNPPFEPPSEGGGPPPPTSPPTPPAVNPHPLESPNGLSDLLAQAEPASQRDTDVIEQHVVVRTATDRIFDEWREATGRNGRTQLTAKRRRLIAQGLKDYGLDDCLDAVRGWVNDPWDERPLHTDLDKLLGEHVEKYRDLWRNGAPVARPQRSSMDLAIDAIGRG